MEVRRVLFSPVGITDPICNDFDGPMLHIIRHYGPHTVVLFMTEEIARHHRNDDRYAKAIARVAPDTRVIVEESGIREAHDFDAYLNHFGAILKRMSENYRDSEILVNVSSGTPQMQSTLCVLAAAGTVRIKPVQVASPNERSNYGRADYNVEAALAANCDNPAHGLQPKNRCAEPAIKNHVQAFAVSQVRQFILEYDYHAAAQVASQHSGLFDGAFLSAVQMAAERAVFDLQRYAEMKKNFGDDCFPLQNNCYAKMLEYYLIMQVCMKKGMIADYMLRLSPLGAEIGNRHLANTYGFNLSSILRKDRLRKEDMPKDLWNHIENKSYFEKPVYVCLKEVIELIGACAGLRGKQKTADAVLDNLIHMREAEEKIRNLAAHSMISITKALVREKTGISVGELDRQIRKAIIASSNGHIKCEHFGLYERMNGRLLEKLEESFSL